jgi:hypothetical protein
MKNNYTTHRRNRVLTHYRVLRLLENIKTFLLEIGS